MTTIAMKKTSMRRVGRGSESQGNHIPAASRNVKKVMGRHTKSKDELKVSNDCSQVGTMNEARDDGEEDVECYEMQPRRRRWWTDVANTEMSLPVIDAMSGAVRKREFVSEDECENGKGKKRKLGHSSAPGVRDISIGVEESKGLKGERSMGNYTDGTDGKVIGRKGQKIIEEVKATREKLQRKAKEKELKKTAKGGDTEAVKRMKEQFSTAKTETEKLTLLRKTAINILAAPETEIGTMEILNWTLDAAKESNDYNVYLSALLTIGYVFRDILPTYKIKLTAQEAKETCSASGSGGTLHSKRYQRIRKFELSLLRFYKLFLAKTVKPQASKMPRIILPIVCDLMQASPHFNFHDETMIPLCIKFCTYPDDKFCADISAMSISTESILALRLSNMSVADYCIVCLNNIIRRDLTLEVTKVIVTAVGRWARNAHEMHSVWKSSESIVRSPVGTHGLPHPDLYTAEANAHISRFFLAGRLLKMIGKIDLKSKEAPVEMQSKVMKSETCSKRALNIKKKIAENSMNSDDEDEEIVKAARAWGSSRVHPEIVRFRRNESDVLREIFVIYLRILRSAHFYIAADKIGILEGVIMGLSCLALRVNAELVSEIFAELKSLIKFEGSRAPMATPNGKLNLPTEVTRQSKLPPSVALLAVNCSLSLLQGEGAALQVDVSWLCEAFSSAIIRSLPLLLCGSTDIVGLDVPKSTWSNGLEKSILLGDEFVTSLLECIDKLINCERIVGSGAASAHSTGSTASIISLVQALANVSVDADPLLSSKIFTKIALILKKFPRLSSMTDVEGVVVSCVDVVASIFWPLKLLGCQLNQRNELKSGMTIRGF